MKKPGFVPLIILIVLWIAVFPCTAIEPAWTFSESNRKIEDIVVAPDGSAVIAGAGKVLVLSRNGTVLANEPFGEIIAQSRDGSSIVTTYSSPVSSTVYMFKKKTGADGNPSLQKMWEAPFPDKVTSFMASDKGDRIAFSVGGTGVYVYDGNTGKRLGYSDEYSSVITMSGKGTTIAGISTDQGLKLYNSKGGFTKKYDMTLSGQPNSLLMNASGDFVVFNAGPYIIAFDVNNRTELWKRRVSGDVNMLVMSPAGDFILAGTDNGTIDLYDTKGNAKWTYYSNSGTGSGQAVKAVAITQDASKIIAGSVDGKIILINNSGTPQWIYTTKNDPLRRVAIAADGSIAVAASDTSIYAFPAGEQGGFSIIPAPSVKIPSPARSDGTSLTTAPENHSTPKETLSEPQTVVLETPTVTITEYSIIRKATQSPLDEMTIIIGLLVALLFVLRD